SIIRPERLADQRHDRIGASGPLVLIMAAFLADPELEGIIPAFVPELHESLGFILRRDLAALHARCIDRKGPGASAEKRAHALALELAAQVPQSGIEPGQ